MTGARIKAIDWLRGVAVLVMIQTHSLTLLLPELRQSGLFKRLQFIDGLVAPSFIMAAGFSLALVQVRGAASGGRLPRAFKSLRRIGEVIGVAAFMTWIWFPVFREPKWFLRIDILSCIGLSLVLALPLFALLAVRPRLMTFVCLVSSLGLFLVTPLAETVRGPLAHFLGKSSGSVFPLLPWAGYVFLGGALGSVAAAGDRRKLAGWLVALIPVGYGLWYAGSRLMAAQPQLQWWVTSNHAERWMVVCAISLLMVGVERALPSAAQRGRVVGFIEVFGTSSLAAYFSHEVLLYARIFGFSFDAVWGKSAGWPMYWALTALLIAASFVATWGIAWIYDHGGALRRGLLERLTPRPGAGPEGGPGLAG